MIGNKPRIVLTSRDLLLLHALPILRCVDRMQVERIASFNSITRANTRLLQLVHAGVLNRFFLPSDRGGVKALYSLSPHSAEFVGAPGRELRRTRDAILAADLFVDHQLAINEVWIEVFRPTATAPSFGDPRWKYFTAPLTADFRLIPDAFFQLEYRSGRFGHFVEVDRGTESLQVIDQKISSYLHYALSGEYPKQFGLERFRVLFVLTSPRRLENVRRAVLKHTDRIFWFATLSDINREGLFAPVWVRPKGGERLPLL